MEMQRHALTSQLSLCFAICSVLEMFPSSDISSCVKRGLLTRTVQGRDGGNRAEKLPMPESSPVLPPSPRCAALRAPVTGTLAKTGQWEAKQPLVSLLAQDTRSPTGAEHNSKAHEPGAAPCAPVQSSSRSEGQHLLLALPTAYATLAMNYSYATNLRSHLFIFFSIT